MASLNKVMLIGNLTRDPEIRYTPKGTAVADLGIAVNRKVKDQNSDEYREEVTFIDVTVWGKTAENVAQYMKKGRPIFVEGRLQLDQWEDRTSGEKRSKLKVVGDFVQFLGSRDDSGGGQSRPPSNDRREEAPRREKADTPRNQDIPSNRGETHPDDEDDDIPF
jgi:single-strand DNA-binding protein